MGNGVRKWLGAGCAALVLLGAANASPGGAGAAGSPAPSVRAIPATALLDREIIEVRGEGFAPYQYFTVSQCVGKTYSSANCARTTSFAGTDARGFVNFDMLTRRVLTNPTMSKDCATVACFIVMAGESAAPTMALHLGFLKNGPLVRAALPAQPSCVPWPTSQWPTGPVPAGVDPKAVAQAGDAIIASGSNAVVVIYGGRVVYEKYASGRDANTIEPSFSMSKSFASTVIGLLVQQGKLQVDARAPVQEWAGASDPRRAITLRNILNMSSGLQWNEIYSDVPGSDVFQMVLREPDEAAYVIAKPLAHTPGTVWNYSTGDTAILGRIISRTQNVSGAVYQQYLHKVLFDPLGINPVQIGLDATGDWMAGWFTNMSTRNFAKLGLLYLRNGTWGGKPFLSPNWVEFVRTPSPADPGYGGQFWLNNDGSFRMVGLFGQTVQIVPQRDLIVAVNNGGDTSGMVDVFRHAVPQSCATALPAVTADHANVRRGGTVDVPVLANDTGGAIGLTPATLTVATLPKHGAAKVVGSNVHYAPAASFVGTDTFSYVVCTTDRRQCLEAPVTVGVH